MAVLAREHRVDLLVARPAPPHSRPLQANGGLALRSERRIQRLHDGFEPREVDVITSAVTQPVVVGDQHRPRRLYRGGGRRDAVRRQYRRAGCRPGPRQRRRHRIEHRVGGPPRRVWTVGAEVGHRQRHQVSEPIGKLSTRCSERRGPRDCRRPRRCRPRRPARPAAPGRALSGSSTALRLLALCNANGMLAPATRESRRAGLPPGARSSTRRRPDRRTAGSPPSASAPPRSSTRSDASSSLSFTPPVANSRSTHSSWASVSVATYIRSTNASGYPLSASTRTASATCSTGCPGDVDPDVGVRSSDGSRPAARAASSMACRCRLSTSRRTPRGTCTAASQPSARSPTRLSPAA